MDIRFLADQFSVGFGQQKLPMGHQRSGGEELTWVIFLCISDRSWNCQSLQFPSRTLSWGSTDTVSFLSLQRQGFSPSLSSGCLIFPFCSFHSTHSSVSSLFIKVFSCERSGFNFVFVWNPDLIQLREGRSLVAESQRTRIWKVSDENVQELVLPSVLMSSEQRDYLRNFKEVQELCPTSCPSTLHSYSLEIALVNNFGVPFKHSTLHAQTQDLSTQPH